MASASRPSACGCPTSTCREGLVAVDRELRFQRELITPEGVDLRIRLGQAGQRAGAFLIDLSIMTASLLALTLLAIGAAVAMGSEERMEFVGVVWLLGAFLLR